MRHSKVEAPSLDTMPAGIATLCLDPLENTDSLLNLRNCYLGYSADELAWLLGITVHEAKWRQETVRAALHLSDALEENALDRNSVDDEVWVIE